MLYGPGRERTLEELVLLLHEANWKVDKISRPGTSSLTQLICTPIIRSEDDDEEPLGAWDKKPKSPSDELTPSPKSSPVKVKSVLRRLDSTVKAQEKEMEVQQEEPIQITVPMILITGDTSVEVSADDLPMTESDNVDTKTDAIPEEHAETPSPDETARIPSDSTGTGSNVE